MIFYNAQIFECTGNEVVENGWLVVENGIIREFGKGKVPSVNFADKIDCKGMTLMPGLIDAHIHLSLYDNDLVELPRRYNPAMHYVKALRILKDTLDQGFTTARDAGGADAGFSVAVEQGLVPGPRLTVCGKSISMTGGHADMRLSTELTPPGVAPFSAVIADGVYEVQKAAREQLRQGADHLKVMAGGGCGSEADEPDTTQYTLAEIKAVVEEAAAANKKVLAHCYSNSSIKMCADAGVYSIEHGNYLNAETAKILKEKGCWLVPTLTTYFYMSEHGEELGIPAYFLRKMKLVREYALDAVRVAMEAGINIGSGSDVVGDGQYHKNREISLKARVMGAEKAIISATRDNAKLMHLDKKIGTIEEGKDADIILVAGNPLKNAEAFASRENIKLIMQKGNIYKNII